MVILYCKFTSLCPFIFQYTLLGANLLWAEKVGRIRKEYRVHFLWLEAKKKTFHWSKRT